MLQTVRLPDILRVLVSAQRYLVTLALNTEFKRKKKILNPKLLMRVYMCSAQKVETITDM